MMEWIMVAKMNSINFGIFGHFQKWYQTKKFTWLDFEILQQVNKDEWINENLPARATRQKSRRPCMLKLSRWRQYFRCVLYIYAAHYSGCGSLWFIGWNTAIVDLRHCHSDTRVTSLFVVCNCVSKRWQMLHNIQR